MKTNKIATLILLALGINTASASELTVADITKKAIESNPEVQAAWHTFLVSGHDVNIARSGYRPTLDLSSGFDYQRRDYGIERQVNAGYAELSFNQMVYDGGRTRNEVKRFSQVQLVRYFELLDTVESTAAAAITAYQDVLRQRELVSLAQENLSKHLDVYKQIEQSSRAGVARAADLEQISGRVSLAESNVLVELSNLHDVSARYLRIIGQMPPSQLAPVSLAPNFLPSSARETITSAYRTNPAFHAAIRNIAASESAVDSSKSSFRPRLNLTARYGTQNYDDLWQNNSQTEGRIGLEFRYNLYNGNRDQTTVRRALDEVNVAKDLRNKVCVDIRQILQISYNDVNKLSEQLPVLNQHRLSSDKVRTAYKSQFDIGQRTLLDVLDSENEYFQAARAFTNANYDLSLAVTRTLAGMGQLLSAINVTRNGLPSLADLGAEPLEAKPEELCGVTEIDNQLASLRDDDGDGVPNYRDDCPDTPKGDRVDAKGCSVFEEEQVTIGLNVLFAHDSDIIDQSYTDDIVALANYLKRYPNTKVEIQGHTSAVGKEWYNQMLSERRAKAVAAILSQRFGVSADRISAKGYASSRPKVTGNSEQAHSQNRRIEANVTAK